MQTMYNLPMPISTIRTRIRQEFERHRYVNKLPVADVLLFKSHAEYQVRTTRHYGTTSRQPREQE
jgi:NADH dehydrogenase (ubiquinone) 1 alpha subcomplex subunit 6